jgi:hypothetical protein
MARCSNGQVAKILASGGGGVESQKEELKKNKTKN